MLRFYTGVGFFVTTHFGKALLIAVIAVIAVIVSGFVWETCQSGHVYIFSYYAI